MSTEARLIEELNAECNRLNRELVDAWARLRELTTPPPVERCAVVAWLRGPRNASHVEEACLEAADEIERGEHWRGGV